MKTELPPWLMPLIGVVGLIVLVLAIWKAITGFDKPVGQDIAVKPGMYSFREEMQKPHNPNKRGHTNGAVSSSAGSTP